MGGRGRLVISATELCLTFGPFLFYSRSCSEQEQSPMSAVGVFRALREAIAPISAFCEDGTSYRHNEETFLTKYRHWRGVSGRSYVFSVYSAGDCPAYLDT